MTARADWSAYHRGRRARQADRGRCIDCNARALGALCTRCQGLNNRRKRERAALFLRMRDYVVQRAAAGDLEAQAIARDVPPARAPRKAAA
jgi:hypothetical protein